MLCLRERPARFFFFEGGGGVYVGGVLAWMTCQRGLRASVGYVPAWVTWVVR